MLIKHNLTDSETQQLTAKQKSKADFADIFFYACLTFGAALMLMAIFKNL